MTERDWLDEIEDNSRISEARSWSIRYTDILRLIAEVRRLRWFEENFTFSINELRSCCMFCGSEDLGDPESVPGPLEVVYPNAKHKPDCEYVAHKERK